MLMKILKIIFNIRSLSPSFPFVMYLSSPLPQSICPPPLSLSPPKLYAILKIIKNSKMKYLVNYGRQGNLTTYTVDYATKHNWEMDEMQQCDIEISLGCRIHWLHLCKGLSPTNECPVCDTKQTDGEVLAMLELWGMRSTPSLPSLPGPLWPGVVASDKGPIYGLNRTKSCFFH